MILIIFAFLIFTICYVKEGDKDALKVLLIILGIFFIFYLIALMYQ